MLKKVSNFHRPFYRPRPKLHTPFMTSFEPAWTSSDSSSATPNIAPGNNQSQMYGTGTVTSDTKSSKAKNVQRALSVLNIGLSALMCASGVLTLMSFSGSEFTDAAVGLYMILFSCLLFIYEMLWWKSVEWLTRIMKKNFGFLFGLKGKALFIVFIAFLNFGLDKEDSDMGIITAVAFLFSGMLHLGIYLKAPELMVDIEVKSSTYNAPVQSRV